MKSLILIVFLSFFCNTLLFSQVQYLSSEKTTISGGAEYVRLLQKAIREGRADFYRINNPSPWSPVEINSLDAITTFDGSDFDDNIFFNSGSAFIPPDPIGVAGTDRVISVINCIIECRTKTGTLLWRDDLAGFFMSLTPANFTFDPKVIYDQFEDRFVIVDLELVESGSNPSAGNTSRILLAVSKTSTPATATSSDWYYTAINSKESIDPGVGLLDYWADYPGFAIDEEAVYVTANMFVFEPYIGGPLYNRLWIIDKGTTGGFYDGGTASVSGGWDFPSITGAIPGTSQPAHVFGATGVATGVGTFLITYDGIYANPGGPGAVEAVQIVRVDDPLGTPTFVGPEYVILTDLENLGGIYGAPALPDAPQSGSATAIEVNNRRTLHAVWRSNELYVTATINPNSGPDMGQTTAHWIQMNTSTLGSTVLTDQGNVGGEDIASTTYTFFPSIAVNSTDDVIIGFSASASSIFAGAYYAGRFSGDPLGTINSAVEIRAGLDTYVRTFDTSATARNRWGDYTGSCVDPTDDESFWVFNEYAITRGSGSPPDDGRWGTVYAYVPIGELPVELSSFTAKVLQNGGVKLDWRTETEVSNYGFDIEKTSPFPSPYQGEGCEAGRGWVNIGFVEGNGNSNSPKDYSFTDNNVQYGNYSYRLKQIDTDGKFEYSDIIAVDAGNIPGGFVLEQNYPNPFNPSTTIKFALSETQSAKLTVFDILGNELTVPFNGRAEGGQVYETEFLGEGLPSGIYFYRLETESKVENRKMLLLK